MVVLVAVVVVALPTIVVVLLTVLGRDRDVENGRSGVIGHHELMVVWDVKIFIVEILDRHGGDPRLVVVLLDFEGFVDVVVVGVAGFDFDASTRLDSHFPEDFVGFGVGFEDDLDV